MVKTGRIPSVNKKPKIKDQKHKPKIKMDEKEKFKNDFERRVYDFGLKVVKTIEKFDARDITCRILGDQLLRSGTSIGANVIEARGSSSKKDYANFFSYALKSANETKYWINLLRDAGKIDREASNILLQEATELAKILAKSLMTMRGKT